MDEKEHNFKKKKRTKSGNSESPSSFREEKEHKVKKIKRTKSWNSESPSSFRKEKEPNVKKIKRTKSWNSENFSSFREVQNILKNPEYSLNLNQITQYNNNQQASLFNSLYIPSISISLGSDSTNNPLSSSLIYSFPSEYDHSLHSLSSHLTLYFGRETNSKLSSKGSLTKVKLKASPFVLIFCYSAKRVTEIVKELHQFSNKKVHPLKLFAKHIKIAEHIKLLKGSMSNVRIAVGTPSRINELYQKNHLSINDCELIIIDMITTGKSWNILNTPETAVELFKFINHALLQWPTNCKIGFY